MGRKGLGKTVGWLREKLSGEVKGDAGVRYELRVKRLSSIYILY